MRHICSDCEREVDPDDPEDVDQEDGTTSCCWAMIICPDMEDDEE